MSKKISEKYFDHLSTNGKLDKEKIKKEIKRIKHNYEEERERYSDTDKIITIGNTYYNLMSLLRFLDMSVNITKFWGGFIEINGTHIYSLSSGKWRQKGSAVWSKKRVSHEDIIKISNKIEGKNE